MQTQNYLVAIIGITLMLLSAASGAWIMDENFDNTAVGVKCPVFWDNLVKLEYRAASAEQSSSGSHSCKFGIDKADYGWGGGMTFVDKLHKGDEVWIRFRLFIPQGFDFNAYSDGKRLKFIRLTLDDASGKIGRLDWYWNSDGSGAAQPFATILERDKCTTDCWQEFGQGSGPNRGRWETYEMYVKWDHVAVNDGGQGRIRTWKNGVLIGDLTDRPTMWVGSTQIKNLFIFGYWNGGSPQTQHLYLDDLVITDVAPGAKDSNGNPYIGVGSYVYVAPPRPPLVQQ